MSKIKQISFLLEKFISTYKDEDFFKEISSNLALTKLMLETINSEETP